MTLRARLPAPPPAGNGTTSLIDWSGSVWTNATRGDALSSPTIYFTNQFRNVITVITFIIDCLRRITECAKTLRATLFAIQQISKLHAPIFGRTHGVQYGASNVALVQHGKRGGCRAAF